MSLDSKKIIIKFANANWFFGRMRLLAIVHSRMEIDATLIEIKLFFICVCQKLFFFAVDSSPSFIVFQSHTRENTHKFANKQIPMRVENCRSINFNYTHSKTILLMLIFGEQKRFAGFYCTLQRDRHPSNYHHSPACICITRLIVEMRNHIKQQSI